jgi:hypothetical protein
MDLVPRQDAGRLKWPNKRSPRRQQSAANQNHAVKLGKAPPAELPAINRYAAESSRVTFRWGPKFGEPYANTQFPVAFADAYYPQTISTYRDPDETPKPVAAFAALTD